MTPFIPAIELAPLLQGSHQEKTARISDALKGELQRFGGKPVHLIATFDEHVVVMGEAGDAYKVRYELSEAGNVHFMGQEVLPVTVVTEENLRQYARAEAKVAVDLFLKGMTSQANSRIAALFPLVDEAVAASDDELIQSFVESRQSNRTWKQLLAERSDSIRNYLGESAPANPELRPKFGKLYDGATTSAELPGFKGLVHEDVSHLLARLDVVKQQAEQSLQALRLVKEAAEAEGGTEAIAALEQYAADLLDDVGQVRDFVAESLQEFGRVDLIAKVFDSVAAEVTSFEVAGAFAVKMATRLADAGR